MGDNLKYKMIGALKWSTIDRFGQQGVQFFIGMLLARLLSADDYGLIGMIMIFVALSYVLVDSGFAQALVRKTDATNLHYDSVFYFNLIISILLYAIAYWAAPLIAHFFNQPALVAICRVLFLAIIFNALYLVQFTRLSKALNYKKLAQINLISTLISGSIGVWVAIVYRNAWALVVQQLAYHFFRFVMSFLLVDWRPGLSFSFAIIKEFSKFSLHLLGTSVLNVLFNYIYVLIIARFYPRSEVGYYTQGNKLNETFNFSIQAILISSSYAMFSQIQNDDERMRRIFSELTKKTALITMPLVLFLLTIAHPFIDVVWTSKFAASAPYFQMLCLATLFNPFYSLTITALNARGKSKITFRLEFMKKALMLLSIFVAFRWGIMPMLWGYIAASTMSFVAAMLVFDGELKLRISEQVKNFIPGLSIGLVIAILSFMVGLLQLNSFISLFLSSTVAIIVYGYVVYKYYNEIFQKMINYLQLKHQKVK